MSTLRLKTILFWGIYRCMQTPYISYAHFCCRETSAVGKSHRSHAAAIYFCSKFPRDIQGRKSALSPSWLHATYHATSLGAFVDVRRAVVVVPNKFCECGSSFTAAAADVFSAQPCRTKGRLGGLCNLAKMERSGTPHKNWLYPLVI